MLRNKWEFSYPVGVLQEAVAARIKYRETRIKVWTKKRGEVLAKIRKSGIKVTEELANQLYNSTQFNHPRVQLDPEMSAALAECHAKIKAHGEKLAGYERWSEILADDPDRVLGLDYDDYLFFFGVGT